MRVLVTGAAGVVGRAVRRALAADHELVLVDKVAIPEEPAAEVVDILDGDALEAVIAANAPIDAVVHLVYAAYDPALSDRDAAALQFDTTVKGTWLVLDAATRHGARRCVYASSMSVYGGLSAPRYRDDTEPWVFDDVTPYGLCKLLGEDVVRYFGYSRGLSGVSLRLYAVHEPGVMERQGTHVDDVGDAFRRSLVADTGPYEAINLPPGIRGSRISGRKAKRLLGWAPTRYLGG